MEKALVMCVVAIAIIAGAVQVGNSLHVFYSKLNCQMAQAKICIIEEKR